jgi:hypothetical protein
MLSLWRAGLDGESWRAMISSLGHHAGRLRLNAKDSFTAAGDAQLLAGLAGDRGEFEMVRYGGVFANGNFYVHPGDNWAQLHGPWLAVALANWQPGGIKSIMIVNHEVDNPSEVVKFVHRLEMLLKIRARDTVIDQMEDFVRFILNHRVDERLDPISLVAAILAHPGLLALIPELNDPDLFSTPATALMLEAMAQDHEAWPPEFERLKRKVAQRNRLGALDQRVLDAVRALLDAHRWPMIEGSVNGIAHVRADQITWGDEDEVESGDDDEED